MIWWRQGLHRLRCFMKNWSSVKDRQYHNNQFSSAVDQPFRFSYTGYITIRRFADLALPYLNECRRVLDIGCGTGEITCELASRLPEVRFTGIDHSLTGLQQARSHAEFLGLKNIEFAEDKAESFIPGASIDLVMMFDAFHHLEHPRRFIKHMEKFTSSFLLIEPHGNWKGGWDRNLDLDWIVLELDKIRTRLNQILDEDSHQKRITYKSKPEGDPVEYRYSLRDFKNIFRGYGLELRGTVSGLDAYPPDATASGQLRELYGEWIYKFYKRIDNYLFQSNLDFWAKHWLICACKGKQHKLRKPAAKPPLSKEINKEIQGPYQVTYISHSEINETVPGGAGFQLSVSLKNTGFITWSSKVKTRPVFISYHWQDSSGNTLIFDGERTAFDHPVGPGGEETVTLNVKTPDSRGRLILAVDIVCEGVTWFSQTGSRMLLIPVRIS